MLVLPALRLLILTAQLPLVAAVDPLVDLGYSSYRGTARSTGITEWLGIRYAAPPLGDLRWRAPQAPLPTNGTIEANIHGPICLPTPGSSTSSLPTSEDCLFLEVYAPSLARTTSKLPVYLFIQGGGFNVLSSANYNATSLIQAGEMDMVVVTFNYRVGLYGFLASREVQEGGETNVGLLDQRMVMQWVQEYICLFGGDPGHVTLGGDSAGSASILLHMMAPSSLSPNSSNQTQTQTQPLFHAALAESATMGNMLTIPQSQYQYDALTLRANCSSPGGGDSLACLRGKTAEELQGVNVNVPYPNLGQGASAPIYMYQPTIDGSFIPDYTYKLLQEGKFVRIPAIFGDDTNGGTIFTPRNTSTYAEMDQFMLDQWNALTPYQLETMNLLYPPAEVYPDTGTLWRTVSNAYGEMRLMCPSLAIGSALSVYNEGSSWVYRYNVMDPAQMASGLGVPHTIELLAVWGPSNSYWAPYNAGPSPTSYNPGGINSGIIPVIQGYWTSFIRSYDPNLLRLPGTPEWGQWTVWGKERLVLQTNATGMEVVDPGLQARCAWLEAIGIMAQQ